MSEKIPTSEQYESLPSERAVYEVMAWLCQGKSFVETRREERGGRLQALEIRLTEPNAEGLMVQLDYTVDRTGEVSIDATYYQGGKGYDYRTGMGYDPRDIVHGVCLGKFVAGVWHGETTIP